MRRAGVVILLLAPACSPPPPRALPPNAIAFGVFGDGPYNPWEEPRFRRLIADVNGANLRWLVHVGDLLGSPCSDSMLAQRFAMLKTMRVAVVYTPGDNEWTDCHYENSGRFDPHERLQHIRKTYFAQPHQSIGGAPMPVETQSDSSGWSEFVENVRWRFGGFLFVTIHMVGSQNAGRRYSGSSPAQDAEVQRRGDAAIHWLDVAFQVARQDSLRGVVVAMHGDPGFETPGGARAGYERLVDTLTAQVSAFQGSVLLIHGDFHDLTMDHPLTRRGTGEVLSSFTRLQTFGSPDIGWVRVVLDTLSGQVSFEPRKMPRRLLW
jgi:hypothetical protein